MKLPRLAIEQYQFTLVMVLLLTLMGVASYYSMPRSEDPQFDFAAASIVALYPGANPTDMEQLVADPIEAFVNELEDLKKVDTIIEDGVAVVNVEFLNGTDPDDAYNDVVEAVASARKDLPRELAGIKVQRRSPTDVNILQAALVSNTAPFGELRRQAEALETRLERVPGVKKVDTWAYPGEEVRVSVDLERMRALHLSLGQVADGIQSASANIPGGDLVVGTRRFNIRTSGDFESLDAIKQAIVAASGSHILYLKDVAQVEFGYADETYRARFDGHRAVFVTAIQREGSNIFDVREAIQGQIDDFSNHLSEDIRLETAFDQSVSVSKRIGGFFANLLQGVALVGLIVLLALGVRASIIVMLEIPTSILMALGWVDLTGYGLQQMSIVGLVIALGLLVDNAIVVTENADRLIQSGENRLTAAMRGTSQVGWAIVSSTATTVLAFLPMVLLRTGTGDFIRSMPVTVIFALTASLLVSLTLTPFLASRFLKKHRPPGESAGSRDTRRPLGRLLSGIIDGSYRTVLRGALAHPVPVLVTALVVFVGSLSLFPLIGVSLFPRSEKSQFMVNIDLPEGSSLDRTDAVSRNVEAVLDTLDGVMHYAVNVGHGNPRIYYNAFPKDERPTHA